MVLKVHINDDILELQRGDDFLDKLWHELRIRSHYYRVQPLIEGGHEQLTLLGGSRLTGCSYHVNLAESHFHI